VVIISEFVPAGDAVEALAEAEFVARAVSLFEVLVGSSLLQPTNRSVAAKAGRICLFMKSGDIALLTAPQSP
jgi:hypothetical protein